MNFEDLHKHIIVVKTLILKYSRYLFKDLLIGNLKQ